MKIIVDIPKEFESDVKDNFQDFFERVKVEIAYGIARRDETFLCGNYERETAEMLLDAFKNMSVIPKMITNGDMIKAVFPNVIIEIRDNTVYTNIDNGAWFSLEWWNVPYEVNND